MAWIPARRSMFRETSRSSIHAMLSEESEAQDGRLGEDVVVIEFEGLERIDDGAPAQWLVGRLLRPGSGGGVRGGAMIPKGFGADARLLHPLQLEGEEITSARVSVRSGKGAPHGERYQRGR